MLSRVIDVLFGLLFSVDVLIVGTLFVLTHWLTEWPPEWPFPYSSGLFIILVGRGAVLIFLGSLVALLFFRGSQALPWVLPLYLTWAVVTTLWTIEPDNPKFVEFRDDLAAQYSQGTLDPDQWRVPDAVYTYPVLPTYVLWGASVLYVVALRRKTDEKEA